MSGKRKNRNAKSRKLIRIYYDVRTDEVIMPTGRIPGRTYKELRESNSELNLPAPHEITHCRP